MLVTPGPDLVYLAGYTPIAITERITMLVVPKRRDPAMIVPILERPDAEAAPSAGAIALHDWTDGDDPYAATAALLDAGRALRDLGLGVGDARARSAGGAARDGYVSMTDALPMLRAVKGADELERLAAAGAAADASLEDIVGVRFAGRTRERDRRRPRRPPARARPLAGRLHRRRLRAQRRQPPPRDERADIEEGDMVVLDFGGLKDGYGSDTTRTVHVGEPTDEEREVFEIVRHAQQAGFEAVRPGRRLPGGRPAPRAVITDAGYGEYFIHRTGHGIGLTTHEPPYMIEGEERRSSRGCASRSSRGSTCPGASACGSRTSSPSPRTAAAA